MSANRNDLNKIESECENTDQRFKVAAERRADAEAMAKAQFEDDKDPDRVFKNFIDVFSKPRPAQQIDSPDMQPLYKIEQQRMLINSLQIELDKLITRPFRRETFQQNSKKLITFGRSFTSWDDAQTTEEMEDAIKKINRTLVRFRKGLTQHLKDNLRQNEQLTKGELFGLALTYCQTQNKNIFIAPIRKSQLNTHSTPNVLRWPAKLIGFILLFSVIGAAIRYLLKGRVLPHNQTESAQKTIEFSTKIFDQCVKKLDKKYQSQLQTEMKNTL